MRKLKHNLHSLIAGIEPPDNLFSGLRTQQGVSPDNVILFRRTSKEAFKLTGSATNYHHRFELVVLLEQGGHVRIGETAYLLEPGECALIFPHQFHHYMDVQSSSIEWLFVTFELDNPRTIASLRDNPRSLNVESMRLLGSIAESYRRGLPSDPLSVSYHLALLLLNLIKAPAVPAERRFVPSADDSRDLIVQKINEYVRKNLKKAPSLQRLASDLGYSASYVRSIFREKLGVTLGLYIRESRLAQAARLLLTTNKTVSSIGKETGFTSLNAFSRAFASNFGIAPKAYAQRFSTVKPNRDGGREAG